MQVPATASDTMKAPPFAYARARALGEVFDLIEAHGPGAKLLAGGQSLLAALNLRLTSPDILIDIGRIAELSGVRVADGKVHIGALTTHAEIEHSPEVAVHAPLLAQAAPWIAHPAIRNAGTLGGSIATADPAAEWPACCVALDAEFIAAAKHGNRRVRARDFFKGVYATDLRPGEVLTGVEFPAQGAASASAFLELALRRGDYAIVGVAAVASRTNGRLHDVHLAYLGAGETPILARTAMEAAESGRPAVEVAAALAADLDPAPDLYSSAATKLHLAGVLTGRALAALAN